MSEITQRRLMAAKEVRALAEAIRASADHWNVISVEIDGVPTDEYAFFRKENVTPGLEEHRFDWPEEETR